MNRNPITHLLRVLFSRKTPAVMGGIVLFAALLALEGVRVTQWISDVTESNTPTVFSAPLVGGVETTKVEADDSGLKRSAPMMEVAPFVNSLTTEDTALTQGAKDKSLPSTSPLFLSDDALNVTEESEGQSTESVISRSEVPATAPNDDDNVASEIPNNTPEQGRIPTVAQPGVPQAPATQVPAAPPAAEVPAVQPPPIIPTATTIPLPTPVPTEVPSPPPSTEVPLPPPPSDGDDDDNGDDDDGDDDDGDDDNGDDDDNDDDDGDDD